MANGDPPGWDNSGELNILGGMLPPGMGGLLNQLGMNPDKFLINLLTGNPFAYQQARLGGRGPSLGDVMIAEQQRRFFDYGEGPSKAQKNAVLNGIYGAMGYEGADRAARARQSMSFYNPVGMATSLAMLSYGEQGANRALTRGFMNMNLYAPHLGVAQADQGFQYDQSVVTNFANKFKADFYGNPNAYGGLNMQGAGEVFQQMAQRNLLGQDSIRGSRIQKTKQDVRAMSRAVSDMQELFGGTIPEIFDKMDAIFGGNAGAMGGQALQQRVLRLKQASMITGQSLQATAQMMVAGGQYATGVGMDAGIGSAGAEQAMLAMGVNYQTGDAFNTRRINSGRLRGATLRANVAAATSRQAQYRAGAYAYWLETKGGQFLNEQGKLMKGQERAAAAAFEEFIGGASTLGEMASRLGTSADTIRTAAMSDEAKIFMADNQNISQFASAQRAQRAQKMTGEFIRSSINRALGSDIDRKDLFDDKGQLRSRDDIVERIQKATGASRSRIRGLVDAQMEGMAQEVLGPGANSQELEAYFRQQRGAAQMRKVVDYRARIDALTGNKAGGFLGVMRLLSEGSIDDPEGGGKVTLGGLLSEVFGVVSPKEFKDKEARDTAANNLAKSLRDRYTGTKDPVQQGKIQTILKGLTSERLAELDPKKAKKLITDLTTGGITDEELDEAFNLLGSDEQRKASELLKGNKDLADQYTAAIRSGKRSDRQAAGRRVAIDAAIRGIGDKDLQMKLRKAYGKGDFDSLAAARKAFSDVDMSPEKRQAFFSEIAKNAEALDSGDPILQLNDVLKSLVEVLQDLKNDKDTTKGKKGTE